MPCVALQTGHRAVWTMSRSPEHELFPTWPSAWVTEDRRGRGGRRGRRAGWFRSTRLPCRMPPWWPSASRGRSWPHPRRHSVICRGG